MRNPETNAPLHHEGNQSMPSTSHIIHQIVKIAAPMYPQVLLGLCSNLWGGILVSRYHETVELDAYGMGVVLTQQTGFSFIWGASNALLTLSSQAYGAKQYHQVGLALQRSLCVIFLLVDIPLICLFLNAEPLLVACGQSEDMANIVRVFALIRVPGVIFSTISSTIAKTFVAIQKAQYICAVDVSCMLTNVSLSFLFIPHYGAVGAAVASVTSDCVAALVVCGLAVYDKEFRKCWPGFRKFQREAWRKWGSFIALALPSMFLLGFEIWVWDAQTFISGYISPVAQATQSIVPQFTCLMYAAGQAMSNGGSTVIGNYLGDGFGVAARRTAVLSMCLTFVFMIFQLLLFWALHGAIPHIFTNDAQLLQSISSLLPFCICFSFLDGHQSALTGILIGVGWQKVATPLVFISYWVIAVPLGLLLGFGKLGGHPMLLEGLWCGMLVGVICHVASFSVAAVCINWKKEALVARERALAEGSCNMNEDVGMNTSVAGTSLVEALSS